MLDQPSGPSTVTTVDGRTCRDIQRSVDALSSGGTVVLASGRYSIEAPILLTDDVAVVGEGIGRSVLELAPGSSCHVFTNADHAKGNSGLALSRFSVIGNSSSQPRPPDSAVSFCNAGYFRKVRGIRVTEVMVTDIRQTGLHFNGCVDVEVREFTSDGAGWSGISTTGTDHISVENVFIRNAGREDVHSGVHFDGGKGVRLVDAWVSDCTGNAVMLDSAHGPLTHCEISCVCRGSKRGLSLSGSAKHDLRDVAVRGGVYSQNREVGILVSNADHVAVVGALVEDNPEQGILLQGRVGARHCTVSSCTVVGNGVGIAEVHQSADNVFIRNRLFANGIDLQQKAVPIAKASASTERPARAAEPADPVDTFEGRCWVCGHQGSFARRQRAIRETYACDSCRANLRYQAQAALLVRHFTRADATSVAELVKEPHFADLAIYEPGLLGPFRALFGGLPHYTVSGFWPDVPPGEARDGVQCEDIMALTFPAETFDLVITSDIFEHVRQPSTGFSEVHRVLRNGGAHLFSIPVLHPLPASSVARVDTSGPDDVFILEPRYHLGPGNSQHIVYNDFGADLIDKLSEIGFDTQVARFPSTHADLDRVITFLSVKRP